MTSQMPMMRMPRMMHWVYSRLPQKLVTALYLHCDGESRICMQILTGRSCLLPTQIGCNFDFFSTCSSAFRSWVWYIYIYLLQCGFQWETLILNGTTYILTLSNSRNLGIKGYNATMKVCQYLGCRRYPQVGLQWLEHWCEEMRGQKLCFGNQTIRTILYISILILNGT